MYILYLRSAGLNIVGMTSDFRIEVDFVAGFKWKYKPTLTLKFSNLQ